MKTAIKIASLSAIFAASLILFGGNQTVHAATFTVTTTSDSGAGSLRQAITDINTAASGDHTIAFNIPGSGPHTIIPLTDLPTLSSSSTLTSYHVTIDGCSQPGSDCSGSLYAPNIQINGVNDAADGVFTIAKSTDGTTIRGLSITNVAATRYAISGTRTAYDGNFHNPDDVTIEYNYIGLAPDGTSPSSTGSAIRGYTVTNVADGIDRWHITNNIISGGSVALGNPANIFGTSTVSANIIMENNILGLDPTGTQARPGTSIFLSNSLNARVSNNITANTTGIALDIRGRAENLLINDNTITDPTSYGMTFQVADANEPFIGPVDVFGNTITSANYGVLINNAPNIQVGGSGAGEANTITDTDVAAVQVTGASSANTQIIGNTLTDAQFGIQLQAGPNNTQVTGNTISQTTASGFRMFASIANTTITNNSITNNVNEAVEILGATNLTMTGNTITHNQYGIRATTLTDASFHGNTIASNAVDGILFLSGITNVAVGGVGANEANSIHDNGGNGITVGSNLAITTIHATIRGNSIMNNGGLGIDLGNDGVTGNDNSDGDTGPNDLLNFPIITSFTHGSSIIQGTYNGAPNQAYTLDFYSSPAANPSNHGEGQTWIGSGQVTTDASGNATFNFTFNIDTPAGHVISATATDTLGNTSEFSGDLVVPAQPTATSGGSLSNTGQSAQLAIIVAGLVITVSTVWGMKGLKYGKLSS